MKNVTFLLGAGASIPAGYSSTKKLTKQILTPHRYYLDTQEKFCKSKKSSEPCPRTQLVRRVICWLNDRTKEYIDRRGEGRSANYEDIYYLASQLADAATELQNPAILPLIERLECEMLGWPEFRNCPEPYREMLDPRDFNTLWEYTCHYIEDVVTIELSKQGNNCNGSSPIIVIGSVNLGKLGIRRS